MKRGAATRGQMARLTAGAEAIEIKATIPDRQIREALVRYGLSEDNDEERYIYFFDTPALDLLAAGVIARARRTVGEEHDSTIKFRPVEPERVGREWQKYRDFKIEADASEKGLVKSASFTMPVERGLIKRVAAGAAPIGRLFTEEQIAFLEAMGRPKIDYSRVVVLGPLRAHRWRFEDPACPWPLTMELWRREDGAQLMEVSIKTPVIQAAAAVGGFMAFLAEVGAERDRAETAKTRWALDYYAARLAPPAPPATAPAAPRAALAASPPRSARAAPRA
jgi:hypothetical protein